MNWDEATSRLPHAHSLALRLAQLGADHQLIADAIGIEPEGVDPLLIVAHAKLEALNSPSDERSKAPAAPTR